MLEIEYEFREQDLIHFNETKFKQSEAIQKKIRNSRLIVPGLLALVGIFYYVYYNDIRTGLYIVSLAALLAVLSPMMMKWSFKQQILKSYSDREKNNMFGHYKLTINPNELVEKSPSGKHKMPWTDLLRVEYGDKYVYIYVDIDSALIIPVETVSKGDLEQFAERVEDMIDRLG